MSLIARCILLATTVCAGIASSASAHSLFGRALKEKYEFRSASCYACHLHKDQTEGFTAEQLEAYKEEPKAFYNEFGKLLLPHLEDKKIDERVQAATDAKKAAREADSEEEEAALEAKEEQIEAELTKDFLEALKAVEAMQNEAKGKTYAELLRAGEIEGVRLPE